ncbi:MULTISPECIES: hypothetical protein [unclassified Devosia]|uniref:hypothetical protein n=1 Tax=unclassified Devosia TaxID=196773 RepID=UPI0015532E96|nr:MULTISPECIES: hypothetical protein [unclassified Devosia]
MRSASAFSALALTLLLAVPAFAQSEEAVFERIETIQGDAEGFGEAFATLQEAFLMGDPAQTLAELANYPFEIAANGELYDIFAPEDLVDNFDTLISEDTRGALASQDYADLIVTSEGVGFGDGVLWMANICTDESCDETYWAITRINN